MHRFGQRLSIVVIALTVWASVACGSDSDPADEQPDATATPQTEQAAVAEPTATEVQPDPSPSPTSEPVSTPAPAATSALAPVPTETPAAEQTELGSCGGVTLTYFPWETEIPTNIDQWNRIIGAANEITTAWNEFVAATDAVLDYDSVVGNEAVISASTLLLSTLETQRAVIAAETDPATFFSPLAEAELLTVDTITELAQLTITAAGGDVDAWNTSIDQWTLVSSAIDGATAVHDIACEYWLSID